jgi:plasminogen activator inhibitor 1 RNA-binding protein
MSKNTIFANMGDDSDDDTRAQVQQKITKTAAKKDARKVAGPKKTEETADAFFAATQSAGAGGDEAFNEVQKGRQPRPATRGGADARGGRGERGGFGGRGRGGRGGAGGRPRTAARTDGDGNPIEQKRERKPFQGKAREDAHPYDRRDGTGKANRGDKKGGHGKGNWGKEGVYKKKEEDTAEKPAETTEEPVEEEKKEAEPEYVEEILGFSLDDFLSGKQTVGPKEGRAAEKLTQKVEAGGEKQKQSTVLQNAYMKNAVAKTTGAGVAHLGIQADDDDVRGGDRRGGRDGGQRGGRKQNAKHALKKTEDDFPTL